MNLLNNYTYLRNLLIVPYIYQILIKINDYAADD